jgi:hypothetical protein
MTGKTPPGLIGPEMPIEAAHVWGWFIRLHNTRQSGMGANAITETEIAAFFSNRGMTPLPWEVEALARLDAVAVDAFKD